MQMNTTSTHSPPDTPTRGIGFYGEIRGKNLESIAKAGWNSDTGVAIEAIPTPVAGGGDDQTLKLEVPWPAPAPHSPLYIWLRGEEKGRATTVKW